MDPLWVGLIIAAFTMLGTTALAVTTWICKTLWDCTKLNAAMLERMSDAEARLNRHEAILAEKHPDMMRRQSDRSFFG